MSMDSQLDVYTQDGEEVTLVVPCKKIFEAEVTARSLQHFFNTAKASPGASLDAVLEDMVPELARVVRAQRRKLQTILSRGLNSARFRLILEEDVDGTVSTGWIRVEQLLNTIAGYDRVEVVMQASTPIQ